METTKVLLIGAAIIVAGGVGWYAYSAQSGDSMMKGDDAMMQKEATTTDGAMMKDEATTTEGAMMKKEDGVMIKAEGDAMMKDTGTTQ